MADSKAKVVQLLVEAHSNELALINTLNAHIQIAEPGSYRTLLKSHLRETESHADLIQRRLDTLGYSRGIVGAGVGLVQNALKQGMVLAKGPVDMIRGGGDTQEKMLRNARDELMTEGLEISSYDALESLARSVGDHETAELAARIRLDEERMFDALRKEIPVLAHAVGTNNLGDSTVIAEPWTGYDDMTTDEIISRLRDASPSVLLEVDNYERQNKNRKTIIETADAKIGV